MYSQRVSDFYYYPFNDVIAVETDINVIVNL